MNEKMKLVMTINNYEYEKYRCIKSFQNINWDDVEVLIYHSSRDTEVDSILELSKAGECVEKIIYINQQINSLYYGLFTGMNADIYDDETMLSDEDTLDYLVSDYKETGMTVKSPNDDVETISKFVATVSKENAESLSKLIKNDIWVKSLQSSAKNVETALVRTDEANKNMVEMFNKTSEIIETLQEGQKRTTEEIEKLSTFINEVEKKSKNSQSDTGFIFATFTPPATAPKTLYVRVCSPCRYLFSFLTAYQDYLKMSKQVTSKLLIAIPKFKQFTKKFENENISRLASDTINIRNIENHDIFVTHEPKQAIMTKFFSMKADILIVIDMMWHEPLIKSSPQIKQLNAISAVSDIRKFQLDAKTCIIPHSGLSSNIVIPTLTNYGYTNVPGKGLTPTNIQTRRAKYFEKCNDNAYKKLDMLLGV